MSSEDKGVIELQKLFGESTKGNFFVVDTIGVPHPFMITNHHVAWASNHNGGILGMDAMEKAKALNRGCGICHEEYSKHETAVLIGCKIDIKKKDGTANKELHKYLLKNKKNCEKEHLAGYAFIDRKGWSNA